VRRERRRLPVACRCRGARGRSSFQATRELAGKQGATRAAASGATGTPPECEFPVESRSKAGPGPQPLPGEAPGSGRTVIAIHPFAQS
jgi:hypothetical protein